MQEFATALALVLVVEGLLWAAFPNGMRRAVAVALDMRIDQLRMGGLIFAALGIVLVWLLRG